MVGKLPRVVRTLAFPIAMIEIQNLSKSFSRGPFSAPTAVLRGVSFQAPDGAVSGLIGANGAGKTTLFKLCAGLLSPDGGQVQVCGIDPSKRPEAARANLSLLPENAGLPSDWTGRDILRAAAALRGIFGAEASRRMHQSIELLQLERFIGRPARGYSRGQTVRVALAREAVAQAQCLILDEPTVGLDFESAARVRSWVRSLAQDGRCVLISTHIVSEIEAMCDQMVGLREGVAHDDADTRKWISDARLGVF